MKKKTTKKTKKVKKSKWPTEWPPFFCNRKCLKETKDGFRVYSGSYIAIPPGTKLEVYVNVDPNDPESDVEMQEVEFLGGDGGISYISAVLTEPASVKKAK